MSCLHIQDMKIDTCLLTEHKLNTTQPGVLQRLHEDAPKVFGTGTFSINATSSQLQASSMHKPRGVMLSTQGGLKGRILE